MPGRSLFVFPFAAVAVLGCSGGAPQHASATVLDRRAAADLDCPLPDLRTEKLDARTRIVRGCGQTATYVETCEQCKDDDVGPIQSGTYRCRCTWVMDSHRAPRATKPAPTE
jgi:hypothetical protein